MNLPCGAPNPAFAGAPISFIDCLAIFFFSREGDEARDKVRDKVKEKVEEHCLQIDLSPILCVRWQ